MKVSLVNFSYTRQRGTREQNAALDDTLSSYRAEAANIFRRAGISSCCPCCHHEAFVVLEATSKMDCYVRQCGRCTHIQQFRREEFVEWQEQLAEAQMRYKDVADKIASDSASK
jgi:bacterioferritin-associated ferredoxin